MDFQNFQTKNIFEITKEFAIISGNNLKDIDKDLEQQLLRLDTVYNNLLKSASKDLPTKYEIDKKLSKRQSRAKNGQIGDLFAAEPDLPPPIAVPPLRRTRRQASMMADNKIDKTMNIRESAAISSGSSTRASRARALSTFMDLGALDLPKANSTFVVDKKIKKNFDESLSPQMFPFENGTTKNNIKNNETYIMPQIPSTVMNLTKVLHSNVLVEETPVNVKNSSGKKVVPEKNSDECLVKNKRREKLEDIDVNTTEQPLLMTRTMKRKLQEENQIDAKKTNVVPLEKLITPHKPLGGDVLPTPHQIRENEAEKRKELYLKSKADQKRFDEQHLKVAKQREEQMKRDEERIRKAAEEKKKRAEKQKEKELMIKEDALKKQKLLELKCAEINAKRKKAEEAKMLRLQKLEKERKLKEAEAKKKVETKQEKIKLVVPSKVITSNLPTSVSKGTTAQKAKIEKTEINTNDYGLNDVSARDSSDDESGPKKPVPNWAKKENRKYTCVMQCGVDPTERDLFFDCPTSISLKEMFKGWNIRDRQRTSSAIWTTPPRCSVNVRKH